MNEQVKNLIAEIKSIRLLENLKWKSLPIC